MIVFHDFLCVNNHLIEDVSFPDHDHIEQSIDCPECGAPASIHYGTWRSQSKWAWDQKQKGGYGRPGLNYGEVDPQTGVAYENWSHKRKVLKEMGLEETGDLHKGTRTDFDDFYSGAEGGRPEGVLVADSIDELQDNIEQDKVDRAATGDPHREGQDSWVSFKPTDE